MNFRIPHIPLRASSRQYSSPKFHLRMGNINHNLNSERNLKIAYLALSTPNINEVTVRSMIRKMKESPMNLAHPFSISRDAFRSILDDIDAFDTSDVEIFYALFEMFDVRGDNSVLFRELMVGVVCSLVAGHHQSIMMLAFEIYDVKGESSFNRADLQKVLQAINSTASYFGDGALEDAALQLIVQDIFLSTRGASFAEDTSAVNITAAECSHRVLSHILVNAFLSSEGTKTFGSQNAAM